jgi:hypothetical protein
MSIPAWSRPLADLLGAPLHAVTFARVIAWIEEGLREGEQLDFKAELYGNGDSARRELAGDLAAFANHRGGVLALGVAEDDQGAAADVPMVALSDAEERRVHQIVAGNVFPHLPVQVVPVPSFDDPTMGVFLVAVGPSPLRPHAVSVNDALRYPRRHGTVTRYLAESEVADLYRNRFEDQRSELETVRVNRRAAIEEIDEDGGVWLAVSAVPTGTGSLTIDRRTTDETVEWARRFRGVAPVTAFLGDGMPVVRPGLRRLRLMTHYANEGPPNYQYAELHADGAAVALHRIFVEHDQSEAPADGWLVPNTSVLWTTAAALNLVVAHAARVGAWGDLSVELTVFGAPRRLGYLHDGRWLQPIDGARTVPGELTSGHTLLLDEMAVGLQAVLAATRLLLTDIFHAFGSPEILLLTPSGALRMGFLGQDQELRRWAETSGVEVE